MTVRKVQAQRLTWRTLRNFAQALFDHAPRKCGISVVLGVIVGLFEGISFLLLIPLLAQSQSGASEQSSNVADFFQQIFVTVGLPISIPVVTAAFIAIMLMRGVLSILAERNITDLRFGFQTAVGARLFQAISQARWDYLRSRQAARTLYQLTMETNRVNGGVDGLLNLVNRTILSVLQLVVAFILSVPATLIALTCFAGLLFVSRHNHHAAYKVGRWVSAAYQRLFTNVEQFQSVMRVAKISGTEARLLAGYQAANKDVKQVWLSYYSRLAISQAVLQSGGGIALAILLALGLSTLNLALADLIVLVLVFARLVPAFSRLQLNFQTLTQSLPGYEAIEQAIDECNHHKERSVPNADSLAAVSGASADIRLDMIRYGYDETLVLNGVNLRIGPGDVIAVTGPTGTGKSTMADILSGLIGEYEGELTIDGQVITEAERPAWRRMVGYVAQQTIVLDDTVRRNLAFVAPDASEDEMHRCLALAQLSERIDRMPQGLDTRIGHQGSQLSGGERQRLAIARELLRRPRLLILDEATDALDDAHEAAIFRALRRERPGLSILIISHRASTLSHAEAVYALESGTLTERRPEDATAS